MTFKTDGFLSPTMEEFRTSLREVPAYKLWLEFAEELNRLGWDMLEDHETPTTDNQRLIISVLFIRAHQSFQAAIMRTVPSGNPNNPNNIAVIRL